jgi:hypothetical protein
MGFFPRLADARPEGPVQCPGQFAWTVTQTGSERRRRTEINHRILGSFSSWGGTRQFMARETMSRLAMGKSIHREILWGTMAYSDRRRSYLFRVDPDGLVAIRVGNPLSWTAFFVVVIGSFVALNRSLGLAALLLGGAVGFAVLGLLDQVIARSIATQPKERVLRSMMNVFLAKEDWEGAALEESPSHTYVTLPHGGRLVKIAIRRPGPPHARRVLDSFLRAG